MARIRVGTSGWTYPYWRGDFYPQGLPQRRELEYSAEQFDTVELNGSFYSLQRPSSYRKWAGEVEKARPDFVFAVKGSRYVTHMRRLKNVRGALANFYASGVLALGAHTGPFLWQLPERQEFDAALLADFFALLPRSMAEAAALAADHDDKISGDRVLTEAMVDAPLLHALEPRHVSFESDDALSLLAEHDIAAVTADTGGRFARLDADTAGFSYVRLHGPEGLYDSAYSPQLIEEWAQALLARCDAGRDVYVYFDNDGHAHAPRDARALADRLRDA